MQRVHDATQFDPHIEHAARLRSHDPQSGQPPLGAHVTRRSQRAPSTCSQSTVPDSTLPPQDAASLPESAAATASCPPSADGRPPSTVVLEDEHAPTSAQATTKTNGRERIAFTP